MNKPSQQFFDQEKVEQEIRDRDMSAIADTVREKRQPTHFDFPEGSEAARRVVKDEHATASAQKTPEHGNRAAHVAIKNLAVAAFTLGSIAGLTWGFLDSADHQAQEAEQTNQELNEQFEQGRQDAENSIILP